MIGTVTKAIIEAIRASKLVDEENISVVIANDNGEGTVNTALPAVAVSVKDSDGELGEFIGGLISFPLIVQVIVITHFDNQAASADQDKQYADMDLSSRVLLYLNKVHKTAFFHKLMQEYDFNMNFQGIQTEQTRGMERELEIDVFVHRLVYKCNVTMKSSACQDGAPLESVDLNCKCDEVKYDDKYVPNPNIAYTWQENKS